MVEISDTQTTDLYQESQEGRVRLKEDNPGSVKAMIKYFRTARYRPFNTSNFAATKAFGLRTTLQDDLENFIVADKYEVVGMQKQIFEHFKGRLFLAGAVTLKEELAAITEDVFERAPSHSQFRHVITDTWVRLLRIAGSEVHITDAALTSLISSIPEFGIAVIRGLATTAIRPGPNGHVFTPMVGLEDL